MANSGALSGLRILEYGNLVSAPHCAKLLADLGAEVIKIEEPGIGDEARRMGPFPKDTPDPEKSGLFLHLNLNKLGITLNLRSRIGAKIFQQLIAQADVLVENNPPSLMKQLGMSYETLREINPRLIMTSITPFGQRGLYRDYKATELTIFHMGGLGFGTPGRVVNPDVEPPLWGRASLSGFIAGLAAAAGTLQALIYRDLQGTGQQVDVSIQAVCASVCLTNLSSYLYQGLNPTRLKAGKGIPAPAHMLPARDGYINLECLEEKQWSAFVEAMGNPEWAQEEIFRDRFSRGEFWDALEILLSELTRQWNKRELSELLQAKGVACTPVNNMEDILRSQQMEARRFFVKAHHPIAGTLKYLGFPYELSRTPCQVRCVAPMLGQHNEDIICGRLGYTKDELLRMVQMKVI